MAENKYLSDVGLAVLISKIQTDLANKVVKVEGKGLSTLDFTQALKSAYDTASNKAHEHGNKVTLDAITAAFTTELKTKLDAIEQGANKTVIDSTLSNTSTNPVQNKTINTELGKKSPLANPIFTGTPKAPTPAVGDKSTQIATSEFVSTAVTKALAGFTSFDIQVVEALPTTGVKGTFYLVQSTGGGNNIYDEYVYTNNKWEKIGSTDVDMSNYWTKTDLVAMTPTDIETLWNATT